MNKDELKEVTEELRNNKHYPDVDITPIQGIGLSDFQDRKVIRKEVIVNFLYWQCMQLNGTIDEEELTNCLHLLKDKRVIMV